MEKGSLSGSFALILTRRDAVKSSPQIELHKSQDLPPGILLGSSVRGRMAPPQSDHCKRKTQRAVMEDLGLNVWNNHWSGSVLTFLWFGAPQGGS